jgi:hypothetical protein
MLLPATEHQEQPKTEEVRRTHPLEPSEGAQPTDHGLLATRNRRINFVI